MAENTKAGRDAASNPAALVVTSKEWLGLMEAQTTLRDRAIYAAGTALIAYVESRAKKPVACCGRGCSTMMRGQGAMRDCAMVLMMDDRKPGRPRGGVLCPECTAAAMALPKAERASVADLASPAARLDLDRITGAPGLLETAMQPGAFAPDEDGGGLDADNVVPLRR